MPLLGRLGSDSGGMFQSVSEMENAIALSTIAHRVLNNRSLSGDLVSCKDSLSNAINNGIIDAEAALALSSVTNDPFDMPSDSAVVDIKIRNRVEA